MADELEEFGLGFEDRSDWARSGKRDQYPDSAPRRGEAQAVSISIESTLIRNFLADCAEANIGDILFGDGRRAGIFTSAQLNILVGVENGTRPPDALDALLPNGGGPDAITVEQIMRAQPLLSDGVVAALVELLRMRRRANGQM